ncbi:MAG: hypothetical protein KY432_11220 [Acidobacteria bacterium]|nr:hypothetical protein [Acidobacteriota bacterium]
MACHASISGDLAADFALRIEKRTMTTLDEETGPGLWIWFAGMVLIALVFLSLHMLFGVSHYAAIWKDVVTASAQLRLDLIGVGIVVVAALDLVARRWTVR